ncbi:unnamed protein product [Zymoseptoria tritici ST99CH_1A5]|uniref:Cyanovirin-N domain-containing protein n=1 Tax=Zymoseptoria tritici ST99CH_1A5 TaxID=1276529 RepID=A0A1Y6LXM3_ZYMTR|nr:unnamed protein product [Zymoseptoria tritici ST99CH_1A5]
MLGAHGLQLLCLAVLAHTGRGFPTESTDHGHDKDTISTSDSSIVERDLIHYGILFNRFADANCEMKSMDRFNPEDDRGVRIITGDFDHGVATSECKSWRDGKSFLGCEFEWLGHLVPLEHPKHFGDCRIFLYTDKLCAHGFDWIQHANSMTSWKMCQKGRIDEARSVRLECRRDGATWGPSIDGTG